jgi:hypothetical protein
MNSVAEANGKEVDKDKKEKVLKKNLSIALLKQKKDGVGDPMLHIGIMTLNNHIPYKKPILKASPVFVNA